MPKITAEYRRLNEKMHEENEHYGTSGANYADLVAGLARRYGVTSILDYGCGKQTLFSALPPALKEITTNYDPCVAGLDTEPSPAELVVCTDVLEHVEPDLLDNVLEDLQAKTLRYGFFIIHTTPAKKFLADGRNAHLTQQPPTWWFGKLRGYFDVVQAWEGGGKAFAATIRRKGLTSC